MFIPLKMVLIGIDPYPTEGLTLRDVSAGYAEGSVWVSATFSPWIWQWFVHPHCKVLQLILKSLKSCIRKSTKLLSWFMITSMTMVYDTYNSSCMLQKNNNAKGHVTCAILCCFEHGQVVAAIKKPFTHFIQFWYTIWLFNIAMENGPFIDGLPIKNGDFPWLC